MSSVIEELTSRVEHPVVAPPFVPVRIDDDRIEFRTGPGSTPVLTLTDADGEGKLGPLLRQLAAGADVRDVLRPFEGDDRAEVASVIHRLLDDDVLRDRSELATRTSIDSYVAVHPLLDADSIDPHLSDRLLLISAGDTGRLLASDLRDAGFDNLALREPDGSGPRAGTDLEGDWLEDEIGRADCVLLTTDRPAPELHRTVNEAAHETETRWLSGRIRGFQGFVGPTVVPGETACDECFRTRYLANLDERASYLAFERAGGAVETLAPFSRVLAGYLALDLLQLLVNGTGLTAGRVLQFDFFEMSVESNAVLKLPRCRTCGTAGERKLDWQRFVTMEGQGDRWRS